MKVKVERRDTSKPHSLTLLNEMYVERGTIDDWNLLHELHYKAETLGIGPKIYRCVLQDRTIGVGVMTMPKMLLSGRNELFKHLKPNQNGMDTKIINTSRAKWLNANSATNSRLVLDTMFRGAGIAYRMQNIMMRMTGLRMIEFQSSMSKFNPFAEKAGIRFTKPKRSTYYKKGLTFFGRWFETNPSDYVGILEELESMPKPIREQAIEEMREFYYKSSSLEKTGSNRFKGTDRVNAMEVSTLLKQLQQLVLASPLYGVYMNPDFERELPERINILEFDKQRTDEPLRL